jgi:hypothetical protein
MWERPKSVGKTPGSAAWTGHQRRTGVNENVRDLLSRLAHMEIQASGTSGTDTVQLTCRLRFTRLQGI